MITDPTYLSRRRIPLRDKGCLVFHLQTRYLQNFNLLTKFIDECECSFGWPEHVLHIKDVKVHAIKWLASAPLSALPFQL